MVLKSILLVITLLITISCGKKQFFEASINPEFQKYTDQFEALSSLYGNKVSVSNIEIRFAEGDELPLSKAGGCINDRTSVDNYLLGSKTYSLPNQILINRYHWDLYKNVPNLIKKVFYARRELILFHELGHCILNRSHDNSFDTVNNRYNTIMAQKFPYNADYQNNYSYYLNELFNGNGTIETTFDESIYL
jgi:hypothetical protein